MAETRTGKLAAYIGILAYEGVAADDLDAKTSALHFVVCGRSTCNARSVDVTMSLDSAGRSTLNGFDARYGRIHLTWKPTGSSQSVDSGFCSMGAFHVFQFESRWSMTPAGATTYKNTATRSLTGTMGRWTIPRGACITIARSVVGQATMSMDHM